MKTVFPRLRLRILFPKETIPNLSLADFGHAPGEKKSLVVAPGTFAVQRKRNEGSSPEERREASSQSLAKELSEGSFLFVLQAVQDIPKRTFVERSVEKVQRRLLEP